MITRATWKKEGGTVLRYASTHPFPPVRHLGQIRHSCRGKPGVIRTWLAAFHRFKAKVRLPSVATDHNPHCFRNKGIL